jgi:hypothetical protein
MAALSMGTTGKRGGDPDPVLGRQGLAGECVSPYRPPSSGGLLVRPTSRRPSVEDPPRYRILNAHRGQPHIGHASAECADSSGDVVAFCERCGEDIAAANDLDRAGDIRRDRRVLEGGTGSTTISGWAMKLWSTMPDQPSGISPPDLFAKIRPYPAFKDRYRDGYSPRAEHQTSVIVRIIRIRWRTTPLRHQSLA